MRLGFRIPIVADRCEVEILVFAESIGRDFECLQPRATLVILFPIDSPVRFYHLTNMILGYYLRE